MGMYTGMCVQSFVAVKLIIEKKKRERKQKQPKYLPTADQSHTVIQMGTIRQLLKRKI